MGRPAHPERVDRLILTTPGNVTSKPETMQRIRESTLRAVTEASYENVRSRLEWLFAPETKHLVSDELVAVRLAIYSRPGYEQAMRNILVLQEPETRARFAWDPEWTGRIAAPTLIIWTSDDPTGDLRRGRAAAAVDPRLDGSSTSTAPATGRSGSARTTSTACTRSS